MKPRKLALLALLCLASTTVFAQDLGGTWQGTLNVQGNALRVVFQVTKAGDGKFTGQGFSVDQGGQAIPMSAISVDGRTVKWKLELLNASYDGAFSADGNAITGTLTQGAPVPLNLTRATPQSAWTIPEPAAPPKPMDPAANPGIDVATVKLIPPQANGTQASGRLYRMNGARLMAINVSAINVITFAYDLHEQQVSGGPSWMSTDKFEIVVLPDTPGQPSIRQMKLLLQKALVDRFQFKFHSDKRELTVYAMTLPASTKHKMTASAASAGNLPSLLFPRPGLLPARNATMTELAQSLQSAVLDRPVVNRTGIEGRYDFTLDWLPDETQFASFGPPQQLPDNGKPNIYDAFQQQLGLKLERAKVPADVLVIDKLERPSEN
jgi:bla regulator protein blaR1